MEQQITGFNLSESPSIEIPIQVAGLYNETLITTNAINNDLVVVDRYGNKNQVICCGTSQSTDAIVSITKRHGNGFDRYNQTHKIPKAINCKIYTFPYAHLLQGPLYIKEFDLVFCTKTFADAATHPALTSDMEFRYRFRGHESMEEVLSEQAFVSFRMLINDASGSMKHCCVYLAGAIVEKAKVTNMSSQKSGMYYAVKYKHDTIYEEFIPLDKLDSNDPVLLRNGVSMLVSRDRKTLLEKLSKFTNNWTKEYGNSNVNCIPQEIHNTILKEHEERIAILTANHKQELKLACDNYNFELRQMKLKLEEAEAAREAAERKAEEWKILNEVRAQQEKEQRARETEHMKAEAEKLRLENERAKFEQQQHQEAREKAKDFGTWIKVIIPAIVVIIELGIKFFSRAKKLAFC